jgi:pyruvate dehydrogenase E1 component beta subunit
LIKTAIDDSDPVLFFEHKMLYNLKEEVPDEHDALPLGRGNVVRSGTDVTIVSYLKTLHEAVKAAQDLERDGISAEVFDPRSLVPFDREGLGASLERTGRLVIAHEAPTTNGFGAEIAAIASESFWDLLKGPIVRVCGRDTPVPYAPELEGFVLPDAQRITESVRRMMPQEVATKA